MGIQGLLPFLQKCSRKVDMSELSGYTVAIDAYCWLHKGAFSCAEKLARGEDTDQYVFYCMKYISMLQSHNIKPILVFDGCHLPAKADTETARRKRREDTRKRAGELLRADRSDEARQLMRRCVDITHTMAHKLICRARAASIDCIVAPYEADAQLAFLNISGIAHCVITEDSDLLVFGCKKVVFKLDLGGAGLLVEQEMLPVAMKMRPEEFSVEKFRQMCVLSGCDYLPSLSGIGLSKACKFVRLTSQPDISKILHKIGLYLNMPNLLVPEEYKAKFVSAIFMFCHQPVFDPIRRKVVPLTPVANGSEAVLPPPHPPDIALQLALGNIDPITMKVVDDWNPDTQLKEIVKHRSIWSSEYRKPIPMTELHQKPPSTTSTFGKTLSVSANNLAQITPRKKPSKSDSFEVENSPAFRPVPIKSDTDELNEFRDAWQRSKKVKLDKFEEELVEIDDLVEPSPSRPIPFSVTPRLTPSNINDGRTLLQRLTAIPVETTPSPPLVLSRYFASSSAISSKTVSSDKVVPENILDPIKLSEKIISSTDSSCNNTPPSTSSEKSPMAKKSLFIVSPSSKVNVRKEETVKPINQTVSSKKGSWLSLLEDEEEKNNRISHSTIKTSTKRLGQSNFKWKPLHEKFGSSRSNDSSRLLDKLLLDTPPNSQESDNKVSPKSAVLEKQANKSSPVTPDSSKTKQTFLAKFGFQPKKKMLT